MSNLPYESAATEFFGAVREIFNFIPNFSERRRREIHEETRELLRLRTKFNRTALEFNQHSRSDELLGLADAVKNQEEKLRRMVITFAQELRGGE